MGEEMKRLLRNIPAIHTLQNRKEFKTLKEQSTLNETLLTEWIQETIDHLRENMIAGKAIVDLTDEMQLYQYIFGELKKRVRQFTDTTVLQRVINATGVVIHTNLGRSRLSEPALKQMVETAQSYSTLEYDITTGKRGSRHSIVEKYITDVTGAEAALVVNNNAAAVYLVLKAFAENAEVIVSRGELVEIGGSFRISEIMALSDANLVEVGTTNKTTLVDYQHAITGETGMILKVHKSNFAIIGFTEEVRAEDLAALAKDHDIPLYEDLGSGTLFDFKEKDISEEPTVQEQVAKGIDIISFSGDKLLGGPQAGIIVGKKKYIDQLKKHQLARVLRVDKFTLASLEATLKSYIANKEKKDIPTVRDIIESAEAIEEKGKKFIQSVSGLSASFTCTLKEGVSKVGGGTMPDVDLQTYVVEVTHKTMTSNDIAKRLRSRKTPIITRIKGDAIQLDFRTVTENELAEVIKAFHHLAGK